MRHIAQITTLTLPTPDRVRGDIRDVSSGQMYEFDMDIDTPGARDLKVGGHVFYHLDSATGQPVIVDPFVPPMSATTLVHKDTGRRKEVKLGFSWTTLLFSPLGGFPLLSRKLALPYSIIAGLTAFHYLAVLQATPIPGASMPYMVLGTPFSEAMMNGLNIGLFMAEAGLSMLFAAHANRWHARSLLRRGYRLPEGASESEISAFHAYVGQSGRGARRYGPRLDNAQQPLRAAYTGASISRKKLQEVFGERRVDRTKTHEKM
jgi:hypothetical protein